MDKEQIKKLERLGINTNQPTIDIFDNLLNVAEHLYNLLEADEEERFKKELERIKKPSN